MDPERRGQQLIAAGEPAWGEVDAGTTSVTYWVAQPSPTETFLYRMVEGNHGRIYFEAYADGRWAEDAMGKLFLQQDDLGTNVNLSGREAAEVMRRLVAGAPEVWRAPDKLPGHGFAMVVATAAMFSGLVFAIGAAFLSGCDPCGPYDGIQLASRTMLFLSPFWLLVLVGLAWRFRIALAAFAATALAMAVATAILGTDFRGSLEPFGLSSVPAFSAVTLPYALAAGAAIFEYHFGPRSRVKP